MHMATATIQKLLNFNIGVLGHVDSGKTSLAKVLSTTASTASFDKHPQSQERGITLDLGFSSFVVPVPDHLKDSGYDAVQCTLVDCPGHASLIRTIIGGAQIIDLMILVIDITKGIQTQTAECLVIGEITCERMIVVLNKIDQIDEEKRNKEISKVSKRISRTLEATKFKGVPIISVSAKPGGQEAVSDVSAIGIPILIKEISGNVFLPKRMTEGPLIYAVDHCFGIKGQGTVMTGTILSGKVSINDSELTLAEKTIEIPSLKITKKIKSMQMFKQPVKYAAQGDRVAICVTQFDPKQIERCIVCSPGYVSLLYAALIQAEKIVYHKIPCLSKAKFHITIGHETVMGKCTFFGSNLNQDFNYDSEYHYLPELQCISKRSEESSQVIGASAVTDENFECKRQFAIIEFEKPVYCAANSMVIGSRLDTDACLKKKLLKLSKYKDCELITEWMKSIINHLYWCAASANGDHEQIIIRWKSLISHLANDHSDCYHSDLGDRQKKWFIPGSKAFEQLSDVVSSKHLLADIKKLSPSKQTSSLESYHSVLNRFAPKLLAFSYVGMHCRLVFFGRLLIPVTDKQYHESLLPQLKVFKHKSKEGVVERLQDEKTVIGKGLFKKETRMDKFIGLKVILSTGEDGKIDGTFGTSGKFRIFIPDGLKQETSLQLRSQKEKKGRELNVLSPEVDEKQPIKLHLKFKRYVFDTEKRIIQATN